MRFEKNRLDYVASKLERWPCTGNSKERSSTFNQIRSLYEYLRSEKNRLKYVVSISEE